MPLTRSAAAWASVLAEHVSATLDHGFDLMARQSDVAKLMIVEFAQHLDGFAPRPKGQHAAHASGEPPAPFTCRAGAGAGKCHGRSPRHWPAHGKAVPWREGISASHPSPPRTAMAVLGASRGLMALK